LSKQAITFDIEGTNTSGNMGVAGNVNYQHRNMFRGAEVFRLILKGLWNVSKGWLMKLRNISIPGKLGTEASLTFPKILGPGFLKTAFKDFLPKSVFL
jgi:hypothetical protein